MSPRAASGAARTESFACCCPCQPRSHRSARHSFAPRCRSHLHRGQSGSQRAKDAARARAQTHDALQEQEQARGTVVFLQQERGHHRTAVTSTRRPPNREQGLAVPTAR